MYTIIKESITNSIKHGEGYEISIDLKIEDDIILRVKDNGIGCDNIIKGNGLKGIEEKAKKNLMGILSILAKKDEGFELIFHIKGDAKGKDLFPSK